MNVKDKLESMLVAHGMFPTQATEVIKLAIPALNKQAIEIDGNINQRINNKADKPVKNYVKELYENEIKIQKPYHITWESPASDYPESLYGLWFITLKPIALKWIDDNIPQAWFRMMFLDNPTN